MCFQIKHSVYLRNAKFTFLPFQKLFFSQKDSNWWKLSEIEWIIKEYVMQIVINNWCTYITKELLNILFSQILTYIYFYDDEFRDIKKPCYNNKKVSVSEKEKKIQM